jgi:ectoine hydroxylase-related dioxygenase (phytanoyl-CoA dioxygenase family)
LCQLDRAEGGILYDACRRLLPVHQLSCHPDLVQLSKFLMGTETLISCNLKAVRIDHPNEDRYLFSWHQDYPYIQDSTDAIVYWIPTEDVTEDLGRLVVALGSHKDGLAPIKLVDPDNKKRNGAHTIELANPAITDKYEQYQVSMQAGDVLVFNTLLLHRSGPNRSNRVRWTMQIRHGNFEHPMAIQKHWPGGMIEGLQFQVRHPEYIQSESL